LHPEKARINFKQNKIMSKKALLMILDGWGIGDQGKDDVIFNTPTPYWDSLLANYPHSELQASGENVGLPDGQMGNSEVGHLNIGAGRIVYQDLVKINRAPASPSMQHSPLQASRLQRNFSRNTSREITTSSICIISY
jgi:2,3-bisphosphoglycerate-independent phosphoglycerate mutase